MLIPEMLIPEPSLFEDRFALAQSVARQAGRIAQAFFTDPKRFTVEAKGLDDITTTADREVEELIISQLAASFPDDGFWGEEGGGHGAGSDADYFWVIDPIDGTRNFTKGIEFWCISIAFVAHGVVELGVVYAPITDELFAARRGHGTTLDDEPITVSNTLRIDRARLASDCQPAVLESWRVARDQLRDAGADNFSLGAGALAIAHVACGRLDAYWNFQIHSWDVLAALLLVREAGGLTRHFPATGDLGEARPTLASAPGIEATLRELTRL
jgi:myo-inositol-1(or 4)-monophosphatase